MSLCQCRCPHSLWSVQFMAWLLGSCISSQTSLEQSEHYGVLPPISVSPAQKFLGNWPCVWCNIYINHLQPKFFSWLSRREHKLQNSSSRVAWSCAELPILGGQDGSWQWWGHPRLVLLIHIFQVSHLSRVAKEVGKPLPAEPCRPLCVPSIQLPWGYLWAWRWPSVW